MGFFDKIFSGLSKTRNNMEELEELFQLVKEIVVIWTVVLEDLLQILHLHSGLGQAGEDLVKKSHCICS